MCKRVALFVVILTSASIAAVSASSGADSAQKRVTASGPLVGFLDDASIYGRTEWAFTHLRSLRAGIARVTLDWGAVARRAPRAPADPADPAYNWSAPDKIVTEASKKRIRVLFAIYGTPRWAARARNRVPVRISHLRNFAFAAAKRYSGTYLVKPSENEPEVALPAVRHWLAWNEPNNPVFLRPQWRRVKQRWRPESAYNYAKICSAIYTGVHATRLRGQKVACGATGPRGNDAPTSRRRSTSPLVFMTWLRRAGLKRFDAYAHHPYYNHRSETPTTKPRSKKALTLGNIRVLINHVNRLWGRGTRIWITEYGYQTRPPDRLFGVSWRAQARYVGQAYRVSKRTRRIDMLIWFLIRDEARMSGWQSGVLTTSGRRKPAYRAFQTLRR